MPIARYQRSLGQTCHSEPVAERHTLAFVVSTLNGLPLNPEPRGISLQFCSLLINYGPPWNPQRVEQRISRCHRYGQKMDVTVVNLLNLKNRAEQRTLCDGGGAYALGEQVTSGLRSTFFGRRRRPWPRRRSAGSRSNYKVAMYLPGTIRRSNTLRLPMQLPGT
jgi:hypothetical protein